MIDSFTCDRERAASVAGFTGINRTGKYVGDITQCEIADSPSGATYIEIAFKAKSWEAKNEDGTVDKGNGEAMAFIRTYITSRSGVRTFGHDIVDALMAVLKIDTMTTQAMTVYGRNWRNDHNDKRQGKRIPALEKQRVGLLLQRENRVYTDNQGNLKESFNLNIITPYDPDTMQNANEIIHGSDAVAVEQKFKYLHDKAAKETPPQSGYQPSAVDTAAALDDDPF